MATTVTCTKYCYFYDKSGTTRQYTTTEWELGLKSGLTYTPSAHMPDYDSYSYSLNRILYNGTNYTSRSMTCPSYDFTLYYYFYANSADIDPWHWDYSNGSASASQTSAAYNAIRNHGLISSFNYLVWNDFVDKVNEAVAASGSGWNQRYTTYWAARMTSDDRVLTARRFNSVRYNIGLQVSTGIPEVSSGDTVYGSYFITMANSLNTFIRSL